MDNHIPMFINIKHISFIFFFFFIIIIITFPTQSHSQTKPPPQSVYDCRGTKNLYNCGHITNISYPFWGQSRPSQCGADFEFYLNCHENITTIQLSLQNFTVLDINTKNHTIKLQRTDLYQNVCAPQFDDTFLSPPSLALFNYLPPTLKNITIYYNCSSKYSKYSICGPLNPSLCYVGDEDELLRNCKKHIQVPVGTEFPIENNHEGYFERDVLDKGLHKGYEMEYIVNEECLRCLESDEGDCVIEHSCEYDNSCPDEYIAYSSHCTRVSTLSDNTILLVMRILSSRFREVIF